LNLSTEPESDIRLWFAILLPPGWNYEKKVVFSDCLGWDPDTYIPRPQCKMRLFAFLATSCAADAVFSHF